MVKLLVIWACVLGTAIAGRIPVLNDPSQSWLDVQRQGVRPNLMDLVSLRWQMNPWSRLRAMQAEDRRSFLNDLEVDRRPNRVDQEDNNEQIETELEERFTRVPLSREVLGGADRTLPTSDANSNRLLHVGRRRQQQLAEPREEERRERDDDRQIDDMLETRRRGLLRDTNRAESVRADDLQSVRRDDDRLVHINRRRVDQVQEEVTPRRISRIGEGRRVGRVGPMAEEDILRFIRKDNRLADMSDEEIIEMLRRERQEKIEKRRMDQREERAEEVQGDDLQAIRRDDERLVNINRRRLEQPQEERPINRNNEEGRRVEERRVEERRESDNFMGRRVEREDVVDRPVDSLKSVRRDDDRLVHINRRRLDQTQEETSPRRIARIGEGRRVGDVDTMTEQDILQFIRRDSRLTNLSDEEIIEMLRRNRQRKEEPRQERFEGRQQVERDEDVQGGELQSLRRNDERLVHINRRRMGDIEMETSPRRISRIGEGRRVGNMDAVTDQDILQFIRWDNRLTNLSDDEILEMLRRQRQEKIEGRREERVEDAQGDDLQTLRRDDERLVHISRRRLDQTQ
ncbi:hypothetical protein ACLKA7_016184 [Drosophila subpalustris]